MSLTIGGLVVIVAGTLFVRLGFSEACSNELIANAPLLVGGLMSWYGRWRKGDINIFGGRRA